MSALYKVVYDLVDNPGCFTADTIDSELRSDSPWDSVSHQTKLVLNQMEDGDFDFLRSNKV